MSDDEKIIDDLEPYLKAEWREALTSPLNRHATRVKYGCDDRELDRHPDWLIEHFIKNGGARWWAETHPRRVG